jgi:hypothetical protein
MQGRRRWQRILGRPLTVGALAVGSAFAFVAVPLCITEGLSCFFVHRNWFRPLPDAVLLTATLSPQGMCWQRLQFEHQHRIVCDMASTVCGLALNLSSAALLTRCIQRNIHLFPPIAPPLPAPIATAHGTAAIASVIVLPFAYRRGPGTFLLAMHLTAALFIAPTMHTLLSEAVRKLVTRGEDKVLDVDES